MAALDMLGVALPVLNGMAYTADSHGKAVLTVEGLGALLPLYSEEVPAELHEQATHVLFNCTSIKEDPSRLALAVREGAVEAMCTAAQIAHAAGAPDGLALAYATLTNLAEGCADGRDRFAHNRAAMDLLLGLCDRTPVGSNDVRVAAAELLLALISCGGRIATPARARGRRQARARGHCLGELERRRALGAREAGDPRALVRASLFTGGESAHSVMWTERDHRRWRRRDGETRRREKCW